MVRPFSSDADHIEVLDDFTYRFLPVGERYVDGATRRCFVRIAPGELTFPSLVPSSTGSRASPINMNFRAQ